MDKTDEYREWMRHAEEDMLAAELLINQPRKPLHIICFHCQQAAEKYIKAYLVSRNVSFEKTHDLMYLVKLSSGSDTDFADIHNEIFTLNPYAVITRYPSELELIDDDAVLALEAARAIKRFVIDKMNTP
jgi:HEPN domain-containing protein